MKIGEFAKQFGVPKDTVRFYIKNNLLIPNDQGAQYEFTDREVQAMQTILKMKAQRFTLEEIGRYLMLRRVSVMVEPESLKLASDLLTGKRQALQKEIEELNDICKSIDADLLSLSNISDAPRRKTGVPLKAFSLLVCPRCGAPLQMGGAALDQRYIYSGELLCDCGFQILIENGIVKTGNLYTTPYDRPDLQRGFYQKISREFSAYTQRSTNYLIHALSGMDLKDKVVFEGHCNGFCFIYNHLKKLEPGAIYILTDKYPEMMEMYKANIERMGLDLDILYIADNSTHLPLRPQCIDVMIDFLTSNEHSLYFKTPYSQDIKPFLKPGASIMGQNLSYPENSATIRALRKKYPEGDCSAYLFRCWNADYERMGVQVEAKLLGTVKTTEKSYSFECHKDGEELCVRYFTGKYLPA